MLLSDKLPVFMSGNNADQFAFANEESDRINRAGRFVLFLHVHDTVPEI
jgi:hypothetical protein